MQGAPSLSQTKKVKADQTDAECFYCRKRGHWKRNCSLYQTSLDPNRSRKTKHHGATQGIYMINLYNFFICDTADQVLNTDSPIHICNLLQGLQISRRFENGEQFLSVENKNCVPILTIRVFSLIFDLSTIELVDCHYCPCFIMSIISVDLLASYGYKLLNKEMFAKLL